MFSVYPYSHLYEMKFLCAHRAACLLVNVCGNMCENKQAHAGWTMVTAATVAAAKKCRHTSKITNQLNLNWEFQCGHLCAMPTMRIVINAKLDFFSLNCHCCRRHRETIRWTPGVNENSRRTLLPLITVVLFMFFVNNSAAVAHRSDRMTDRILVRGN